MEHVLRQCLIALRLADHARPGERGPERSTTPPCWSTSAATRTRTSRRSGSATTSRSSPPSTRTSSAACAARRRPCGWSARANRRCTGSGSGSSSPSAGIASSTSMITRHAPLARTLRRAARPAWHGSRKRSARLRAVDGAAGPVTAGDAIPVAPGSPSSRSPWRWRTALGGVCRDHSARGGAGRQFDPALVALLAPGRASYSAVRPVPAWETVIAAEPALAVELSEEQLDGALAAIANFVDLKSPYTLGHSVAVAELAAAACRRLGLPAGGACCCAGRVRATGSAPWGVELRSGTGQAR